jgi:uncharacterized SAM-dependent methyltransferase
MGRQIQIKAPETAQNIYDEQFFDDMHGIFPDASGCAPTSGGVGKYIYDGGNWNEIVEHSSDFYIPKADHELTEMAVRDFAMWSVPSGTPYVDFGVGGPASFKNYALPILKRLNSKTYCGVDFCSKALARIKALEGDVGTGVEIKTEQMDFFLPTNKVVSPSVPALGVMNGLTLTNFYGTLNDRDVGTNLIVAMRQLSRLCRHGWLLLSIDTNQEAASLKKAYVTPLNSKLYLSVFLRMAAELPTRGFDPSLFEYDPEWHPELQLWAHMARATEGQEFTLGDYSIRVSKGQKIHLLNSYKFAQPFFEYCCHAANLSVTKHWEHETGMMLYLLKDRLHTV